jgi:hypothetical protein
MIQNSISCIVPEKDRRRNLTLRTNSSDVMENDVLQRLSLVDSPSSASSSFGSSFSADEPWSLSSYELPSPWNVEESRFDLSSSSPTATIHQPQVSQIRSIFRHQDQRQEHDDTFNEEEDEAYLEFFSPEKKGSFADPARMTPSSSFEHPSPLVRRIPTSPKRKSIPASSPNNTKRSCRSWIRLATPIAEGSYDEEFEDIYNNNKVQIITE